MSSKLERHISSTDVRRTRGQVVAEYLIIFAVVSLLTVVAGTLFKDFVTQMGTVRDTGVNKILKP